MSTDYELFKGKSLSSLFEDIYNNSKHNKTQLEVLVKEVTSFIKDGDMAVQLIPMIKEYLEINVTKELLKLSLDYPIEKRNNYLKVLMMWWLIYKLKQTILQKK